MRTPFRLQVFALVFAAFGATLLAWGSLQTWLSQNRDRRLIEERLVRTVELLERDRIPLDDGTARRIRDLSGFDIAVRDDAGEVVAGSSPFVREIPSTSAEDDTASDDLAIESAARIPAGEAMWLRWTRVLDRRRMGGERLALEILYPVAALEAARRESFVSAWGTAALFLPLGFAAAWFFSRRVTSPLSRLRDRLDRLAEGDYDGAEESDRSDEIGEALRSAATLGQRLREYEARVRRQERLAAIGEMGAGVAHQMRNAVTGALLGIDLHRRACPIGGGAKNEEPLDVARRQLAGMEAYLRRFLQRATQGTARRERIDLRDVMERVRAALGPLAAHQGIDVTIEAGAEPALIDGDPIEIEQMLLNVATNALEAAADRRTNDAPPSVELIVANDSAGASATIRDNGPETGRPLDRSIFEPLVTSKPDGVGLGLTVAKRVADEHDAAITVDRADGKTVFTIRFPPFAIERSAQSPDPTTNVGSDNA